MKDILVIFLFVVGMCLSVGPSIYHANEFGLKFFDWSGEQRWTLMKLYWPWYVSGLVLTNLSIFIAIKFKVQNEN